MREVSQSELSGTFVVRDPAWREKVFYGGLLLILFHPIGWPAALGYRKELIKNLYSGAEPLLPGWKGNVAYFFIEGLKAMGVIFGYLSPLYLGLLLLLLSHGVEPNEYWLYTGLLFLSCTIFSTLSFPAILLYWTFVADGYQISLGVCALLLTIFALVIFFIPAGFLQVSKTGRYRSAFNIPAAWEFLVSHFRQYVRAWYHSALMSLAGHLVLPFAPWGVIWCYLGIIFEFNSIAQGDDSHAQACSWFHRLQHSDRIMIQTTGRRAVYRCMNPADTVPCYMLKMGPILIPLPTIVQRCSIVQES